jgi:hypothetical protein
MMLLLLGMTTIQSCQNDFDAIDVQGGLRITLDNVSSSTVTRSTPSQLWVPTADMFRLCVEDANGIKKYDGPFTEDVIKLKGGTYFVTAEYGENPILATDQPYYIGTAQVDVENNKVTDASLECKVGNALVSVVFGQNEEERARFSRFYSEYGLKVKVANYSVTLSNTSSNTSAYFRAGTSIGLEFTGVLKDVGQPVSCELDVSQVANFPQTFQAADHAIITLTLPEPQSAAVVTISKFEMQEATMNETIPLSWLPIAVALPEHQYDYQGDLVGTNITFPNAYPGSTWKAVVTNSAGTVVRAVQGTGNLLSDYSKNAEWPYLPAGQYRATYYIIDGETETMSNSRDFVIRSPKVSATVDAWTSYDKYLAGDIAAANACTNSTAYEFQKHFSVSPSIANNSKYNSLYSWTATVDGNAVPINANELTGLSFAAHTLKVTGTFDGATASAEKTLQITGLPYDGDACKFGDWTGGRWSDSGDSGEAQAREPGQPCYLFTSTIYTPKFHVPANINFSMSWSVWFYALTMRNSNYGWVANTNTAPSGKSTKPSNYTWTSLSDVGTLKASAPYFGMTHESSYTWGLNSFKILYQ